MTTKLCSKCKQNKQLSDFTKANTSPDGLGYICKNCRVEYNTQCTKRAASQREADRQIEALKTRHITAAIPKVKKEPKISLNELCQTTDFGRLKSNLKRGIYLISDNLGHVKIGVFSGNPNTRMADLQVGNPHRLTLIDHIFVDDPFYEEKIIHTKYDHLHIRGEWFKFTPEVRLKSFGNHELEVESTQRNQLAKYPGSNDYFPHAE